MEIQHEFTNLLKYPNFLRVSYRKSFNLDYIQKAYNSPKIYSNRYVHIYYISNSKKLLTQLGPYLI